MIRIIAVIIIAICMFLLGYCCMILRVVNAMQRTLRNTPKRDSEFERGVYWAVTYILDSLKK